MKLFICDKIFNIDNVNGKNYIIINTIRNSAIDDCILFFIEDVDKRYNIKDYLLQKDIYNCHYWKNYLHFLNDYKIFVVSKEMFFNDFLYYNKDTILYYFCEKKNIYYNEKFNHLEKYLYLDQYDNIDDLDKRFFTKIYSFNSIQSNDENVEFIKFEFKNNTLLNLFNTEKKENIMDDLELPKDSIIIFIHFYERDFYHVADRIILAITELQKQYKIYPVFYWSLEEKIVKKITKRDLVCEEDNWHYDVCGMKLNIDANFDILNLSDDDTINIEYNISRIHSTTNKDDFVSVLNTYFDKEYRFITEIDYHTTLKYIYASDIFIPVNEEINYTQILSQIYKTYTIFTGDGADIQEYCIYGDIPLLNSKDYLFNSNSKKIKKNLRVEDMKNSIENYIIHKKDPFFVYKKEFCEYLF